MWGVSNNNNSNNQNTGQTNEPKPNYEDGSLIDIDDIPQPIQTALNSNKGNENDDQGFVDTPVSMTNNNNAPKTTSNMQINEIPEDEEEEEEEWEEATT